MPVIPSTWEAEAGESLEPRRQRLQEAKIIPAWATEPDSVSEKKKERKKKKHSKTHGKCICQLLESGCFEKKEKRIAREHFNIMLNILYAFRKTAEAHITT